VAGGEIRVRPAAAGDGPWLAACNAAMARETEDRELDAGLLRAGVEAALADPEKGRYLVAERGGEAVGCLFLTREWSDWRNGWFWWIQSVYVLPAWRRRGVYRALYAAVLAEARARAGVCGLRLYVERENRAARRVYTALGMAETSYRLYEVDFRAPPKPAGGREPW